GLGLPFLPALLGAFLLVALLSVPIERLAYRPLYRRSELDQVLLTIGLLFMAIAGTAFLHGPTPPHVDLPGFLTVQVDIGIRQVPAYRLFTILLGFALMLALWLGLERTLVGARIRAAVDNREMAQA